jgi:hypothetical protein
LVVSAGYTTLGLLAGYS